MSPTEISSIMRRAKSLVQVKLQPGVMLNVVLGAAEYTIISDADSLTQILVNLLSNACKFTNRGAITFGFDILEDEVYFFVRDTGVGLTPPQRDSINDFFSTGSEPKQSRSMGLTITCGLVKQLGGEMGVESRGLNHGSTFWFTLPNKQPEQTSQSTAAQAEEQAAPDDGRPTILIAEDVEHNYQLLAAILEPNYNLVRARDGLEAVDLFRRTRPSLALMDIMMPNLDGYGAVKEIRKFDTTTPILAVTAYAFVTDRQRILENGFNGYLSKPINVVRLEREIRNCLNPA